MSVPSHHQLIAVGGEAVQHPRFRRMGQSQPQIGGRAGRTCDGVITVASDVRIVDAGGGDVSSRHFELAAVVGQVEPAAFGERRAQILPGQWLPCAR